MNATLRMIGFSGHVEISRDSVPLISKALRDRLGTMHGPFVGITMMGPGADQVFARSVLETGGHLYVVMPTLGFQYRDEFEDPEPAMSTISSSPARPTSSGSPTTGGQPLSPTSPVAKQ
jgi:hypothetical protein